MVVCHFRGYIVFLSSVFLLCVGDVGSLCDDDTELKTLLIQWCSTVEEEGEHRLGVDFKSIVESGAEW